MIETNQTLSDSKQEHCHVRFIIFHLVITKMDKKQNPFFLLIIIAWQGLLLSRFAVNRGKMKPARNSGWFHFISVPLGRLELPFLAPEANALSTELQGRVRTFYHEKMKSEGPESLPGNCSAFSGQSISLFAPCKKQQKMQKNAPFHL